jgi:hypothetical protein
MATLSTIHGPTIVVSRIVSEVDKGRTWGSNFYGTSQDQRINSAIYGLIKINGFVDLWVLFEFMGLFRVQPN